MTSDASPLATSFRIGNVEIPNRVVLAPMAGLTNSAYRRHLKAHGAGLVTTEMVSAYGLAYRNVRTGEYLDFAEEERPLAVQLFGDTPEVMARAAEEVLSRAMVPDLLDPTEEMREKTIHIAESLHEVHRLLLARRG